VCTKVTVRRYLQFGRHRPSRGHASCTASWNWPPAIQLEPPRGRDRTAVRCCLTLRRSLYAYRPSVRLHARTMPSWSLGLVTIYNEEGAPGRGTEHPRAFALAPGGDSGAVPAAMAIRAGAEMATPKGRRHRQFRVSKEYIQWRRDARNVSHEAWRRVDREFRGSVVCCVAFVSGAPSASSRSHVLGPAFQRIGRSD
jgi:hypothetical protein